MSETWDGTVIIDLQGSPGISGPALTLTAAAALPAGAMVSFGPAGVILADATDTTKPANGFVATAVALNNPVQVLLTGSINAALTGLTPGAIYFLGHAGAVTSVPPLTGALQIVGYAADATHLVFDPQPSVLL